MKKEDLNNIEIYKSTLILELSDNDKNTYLENLENIKENIKKDIYQLSNSSILDSQNTGGLEHLNKSLEKIDQSIYKSKRTIYETEDFNSNINSIGYQDIIEKPMVLIIDKPNSNNISNNELSMVDNEKYESITKNKLERDIALLKYNNGYIGITQSFNTGKYEYIDLKNTYLLKPDQVISYLEKNNQEKLKKLQYNYTPDYIEDHFNSLKNTKPEFLHDTPYIYNLSNEQLQQHIEDLNLKI